MSWIATKTSFIYGGPYEGTLKKSFQSKSEAVEIDVQCCFVEKHENLRESAEGKLEYKNNIRENIEVTLGDLVEDEKVKIGQCYPFQGKYNT